MIAAAVAFALMSVFVKWSAATIPAMEVVFFRSAAGLIMISAVMLHKKISFLGKSRLPLLLRGISGFLALSLNFLAIAGLPLGTAVMLNYTAPVFVPILGIFFLKEKTSRFLWAMILLAFAGIFLLTGAHFARLEIPVLYGLSSGVFAAIAYTSIRALKEQESPYTIIFYFTAVSTLLSAFFLFPQARWPATAPEWLSLSGIAVFGFYGQVWMTIAYQRAPAALVSPFSYLTPVLTFLAGAWLWKDPLNITQGLGVLIIIASGYAISLKMTGKKPLVDTSLE